jgi:hypothetical protein
VRARWTSGGQRRYDIAGHIRYEHVAELQVADRVDQPSDKGKNQKQRRKRSLSILMLGTEDVGRLSRCDHVLLQSFRLTLVKVVASDEHESPTSVRCSKNAFSTMNRMDSVISPTRLAANMAISLNLASHSAPSERWMFAQD